MSTLSDALKGVQRLLIMQEKIAALDSSIQTLAANHRQVVGEVVGIDKRVVRIEAMIEVATARAGQSRIEGG
jgi:hypothetical protein